MDETKETVSSLAELEWVYNTLWVLYRTIRRHAFIDDRQTHALEHLMRALLWTESIIQEHRSVARRRRDDFREATEPKAQGSQTPPQGSPQDVL